MVAPLRKAQGFSLLELMIVVAIIGIMGGIASLGLDFVQNFKMRDTAADIQTSVMLARSEAIKRNATVSITPTATSGSWSSGWSVVGGGQAIQVSTVPTGITITGITGPLLMSSMGRPPGRTLIEIGMSNVASGHRCVTVESDGRSRVFVGHCI